MDLIVAVFMAASFVTFASYQVIPNAIERLESGSIAMALVQSSLFTAFVRYCGFDHLVMATAMAGMMFGWFENHMAVWLVITFSSCGVALVSAASALVILRSA